MIRLRRRRRPEDLVLEVKEPVRRFLERLLGDAEAAEDVTHEVLLVCLARWREGARQRRPVSFALKVAWNKAQEHRRRSLRRGERVDDVVAPDASRRAELEEWLLAGLATLHPEDRAVIYLRYGEELPYREIARILGCRAGTARWRLHEARKSLKDALERVGGGRVAPVLVALLPLLGERAAAATIATSTVTAATVAKTTTPVLKVTSHIPLVLEAVMSKAGWAAATVVVAGLGALALITDEEEAETVDAVSIRERTAVSIHDTTPTRKDEVPESGIASDRFRFEGVTAKPSRADVEVKEARKKRKAMRMRGRVVDRDRRPVPDATVTVLVDNIERRRDENADPPYRIIPRPQARTGPDGCFVLDCSAARLRERTLLHAEHGDRAVLQPWTQSVIKLEGLESGLDVGDLVIEQKATVDLDVTVEGGPAEGATVRALFDRTEVFVDTTGPAGRLSLSLPVGTWQINAKHPRGVGEKKLVLPEEAGNQELVLAAPRRVALRVIAKDDRTPIPGARVMWWSAEQANGRRASPTDDDGRTQIGPVIATMRIRATVEADGYLTFDLRGDDGRELYEITLERALVRSWRLIPVEGGAPPDGTHLRIETLAPTNAARVPKHAVARSGRLEISGLETDQVFGSAWTEDGRMAFVAMVSGRPFSDVALLHHPRTLTVRVLDSAGSPAPGHRVQIDATTLPWIGFPSATTDAAGVARLGALPAVAVRVVVDGTTYQTIDLLGGDHDVTVGLVSPRKVVVSVTVDGQPALPVGTRFSGENGVVSEQGRDTTRGEARLTFLRTDRLDDGAIKVTVPGYPPTRLVLALDGTTGPLVVPCDISSGARLVVEVIGLETSGATVVLERHDAPSDRWVAHGRRRAVETSCTFVGIASGRWRARDARSGTASGAVVIRGPSDHRVSLDLSALALLVPVTGHLQAPEPFWFRHARVRAMDPQDGRRLSEVPVHPDTGAFEILVPLGRPVLLEGHHSYLTPHPDKGRIEVVGARTGVSLVLEKINRAVWLVQPHQPFERNGRALVWRGPIHGPPDMRRTLFCFGDQVAFGGTLPGRYSVFLDLPPYAPMRLYDVRLDGGKNQLGNLTFRPGSGVHVRLVGTPVPVRIRVTAKDGPVYVRERRTAGSSEVTVTGLLAGRARVVITRMSDGTVVVDRDVVVPARGVVDITCPVQ